MKEWILRLILNQDFSDKKKIGFFLSYLWQTIYPAKDLLS